MTDWIIAFIEQHGYLGIALLMVLENVFPPIPSELIMPFAGYAAARGDLHLWGVTLAGLAGSVTGTLPWYWAGRLLGSARLRRWAARHGRWLTVSPDDITKAEAWFHKHGHRAVLIGRLVPAVRTLVSVPAGIANMPLARFLGWSVLGSAVWTGALAGLGYALESQHERVAAWLDPVTKAVIAACVLVYLYRVATFNKRHAKR